MKPTLEIMLFGLAIALRSRANNPSMQTKLRARRCAVQIRTRDGGVARYFVFCGGTVFSRRGLIADPDVSFVWKNADVAIRVLRSPGREAAQDALANEWLSIEGDGEAGIWFSDVVRLTRGVGRDAVAPKPSVAVIGLGRMGAGLARCLLRAGFPLTVYNRSEGKLQPFLEMGAKVATTPAAAARGAQYVITSLMDDAAVFTLVEGKDGLLAGLAGDAVHIGASTVSLDATRRLVALHAAHGSAYLASPVLGRPDAASSGELAALVCGQSSVFARSHGIIECFTRHILYLGEDPAVAAAAKLALNYSAITVIDLMGQVYAFGEKAGIPLSVLHTLFRSLWAQPALQGYASRVWRREFDDVGFDLRGGLKDVTLMVSASREMGVHWDFAEVVQRKMTEGVELGLGARDWSSIYEVRRAEAGLPASVAAPVAGCD